MDRVDLDLDRPVDGPLGQVGQSGARIHEPELEDPRDASEKLRKECGRRKRRSPSGKAEDALRRLAADQDVLAAFDEVLLAVAVEVGLVADQVDDEIDRLRAVVLGEPGRELVALVVDDLERSRDQSWAGTTEACERDAPRLRRATCKSLRSPTSTRR